MVATPFAFFCSFFIAGSMLNSEQLPSLSIGDWWMFLAASLAVLGYGGLVFALFTTRKFVMVLLALGCIVYIPVVWGLAANSEQTIFRTLLSVAYLFIPIVASAYHFGRFFRGKNVPSIT